MDEMRVMSKFMCGIIAKLIECGIRKCCGVKAKVTLSNVAYTGSDNGKATISIKDCKLELKSEDLERIVLGKLGTGDEE